MDRGGHDELSSPFKYVTSASHPPPVNLTELLGGSTMDHYGELATALGLSQPTDWCGGATTLVTPGLSISSSSDEAAAGEGDGVRLMKQEVAEAQDAKGYEEVGDKTEEVGDKTNTASKSKKKAGKRPREPRLAFVTKTEVDHLEDGYRWRKYGQKAVKSSPYPRSYYRCTTKKCQVKKRVERSNQDPSIVVTTYEGKHTHLCPTAFRCSTTQLLAPPPLLPHPTLPSSFYHELMIQQLFTNWQQVNQNPNLYPASLPPPEQLQFPEHGLLQVLAPSVHNSQT